MGGCLSRPGYEFCWFESFEVDYNNPSPWYESSNTYAWGLFFVPMLLTLFGSMGVLGWAIFTLSKGLQDTFGDRSKIVQITRNYVISQSLFWLLAGILYAVTLAKGVHKPLDSSFHIFAFMLVRRLARLVSFYFFWLPLLLFFVVFSLVNPAC